MNPQRIILLIIALLGIASAFFPWGTSIMGPRYGFQTDGIFVLLLFCVCFGICYAGNRKEKLPFFQSVLLSGLALLAGFLAWRFMQNLDQANSLAQNSLTEMGISGPSVKAGSGAWIALVSGIATPVFLFLIPALSGKPRK